MNTKEKSIFMVGIAVVVFLVFVATPATAEVVDIEDGEIDAFGATTVVNITLGTALNGLSGYNMTVNLSEPGIAEIVGVEFPPWATLHSNSTLPADSFWIKACDMNNQILPGATNINLAKLTIRGDVQGECDINVTATQMDADGGGNMLPGLTVDPGDLTVAKRNLSFSPHESAITIFSTGQIAVVLDEAPNGLASYNVTVSLSNTSIAEIISVSFPAWAISHDNSLLPADSVWIKAVDTNNCIIPGATNINLGTLTIRGDNGGISNITIIVTAMDNDGPYSMPVHTIPGQIEVIPVVSLPGHVNPPTDPDGDGIYEDMNGNGVKDFDDIVVFFNNMEWIGANEPVLYFDFNGNGRIDFDDIVKLFEEL